MTTRVVVATSNGPAKTSATIDRNGSKRIRETKSTPIHFPYLVCDDPTNHSPFVNPRAAAAPSGESSWPCRSRTPSYILKFIEIVDSLLVSWWIMYVLRAYHDRIPLSMKRNIIFVAWGWYVWIHTLVVCRWMGYYSDLSFYGIDKPVDATTISDEFKAFSTLMYLVQFYPVDVPRMRFGLGELNAVSLRDMPLEDSIEVIECDCSVRNNPEKDGSFVVPVSQRDYQTVTGYYVNNPNKNAKSSMDGPKTVLFWIYGGAYLAGDAEGNLCLANEFMVDCNADAVFVPSLRLAPEATIDDVLWDISWSYRYLLRRMETEAESDPSASKSKGGSQIVMVGISSGGALVLRLLQLIRDRSSVKKRPLTHQSYLESLMDDITAISVRSSIKISGALLFAPYVDYRDPQPSNASFVQNAKYDWIVTESVQHYCLPYLYGFIPPLGDDLKSTTATLRNTNGRIQYSPLCHDMNDLPPLCLVVSEHEACYDMSIEIANKARGGGGGGEKRQQNGDDGGCRPTEVTIGVWKYMCHVFSMVQALLPEGRASIEFTKDWIRVKTKS